MAYLSQIRRQPPAIAVAPLSSRLKEEKGGEKEEKEKVGKKGKTGKETGMRSAAHLKKEQVYLEQLIGYGLELSNKLLEERANHAREVAALKEEQLTLKEAHLAQMKEAYCQKRACLSDDASQHATRARNHKEIDTAPTTVRLGVWDDKADTSTTKSLDGVAPELRPEAEASVETWRKNSTTTKTLKGKSLDEALPSKNCVTQRSKGASSNGFCLLPRREQELSTAMRKKYGKAAAPDEFSPSDGAGNDGVGTRLSNGNGPGT
ncbi:hypothetical protein KC349_g6392 [Hortaea werneckii]|nr:hypothetical protein KC349_g6392 [Hortaea werneckii]